VFSGTTEGGDSGTVSAEVTKVARGKIKIVLKYGDTIDASAHREFQGLISGNKFYSEESFHQRVTMKWEGVLTANDRIEGTLVFVEHAGQPKKSTWTLVKQE
jgi:hypothetical protein